MKTQPIDMSGGCQRGRLVCALLKQGTTARAQSAVRMCFHYVFFQTNARQLCLNWLPSQMFQQIVRTNVKEQCQEHIAYDLARPWPRPGEFLVVVIFFVLVYVKWAAIRSFRVYSPVL